MADLQPSKRPNRIKDITGQRFGKWTVLEFVGINSYGKALWKCQCDCSKIKTVFGNNLNRGRTTNCGCEKGREVMDLTKQVFGRLTPISYVRNRGHHAIWICQCVCGRTTTVSSTSLRSGNTSSCGCLGIEATIARSTVHGGSHRREYNIWKNMKQRCLNPSNPNYAHYYGGRGITITPEWIESFQAFFNYMGPCAEGFTIERIDNERGYEPGNVKWASRKEQANNTRRNKSRPRH